jgi:uncharacterized delta-60 repeat protein
MKAIFTLFVAVILINNISAQPGMLDSSFGEDGKVVSQTYDGRAYAGLLQPDGKLLLGGFGSYYKGNKLLFGSLLVRYNTDGNLDLNFADSGRGIYILDDTGGYTPEIKAMTLQPDGKIVALGTFAEQNGFLGSTSLMRFNADGSPDKSFGTGGLTVNEFADGFARPKDMALLPDGRIIVVGDLYKNFYEFQQSFIACYTTEGKLDKNFADTGIIKILKELVAELNGLAITSDSKIVAGGAGAKGEVLFRYNSDGTPDFSFGENGLAIMPFEKKRLSHFE